MDKERAGGDLPEYQTSQWFSPSLNADAPLAESKNRTFNQLKCPEDPSWQKSMGEELSTIDVRSPPFSAVIAAK